MSYDTNYEIAFVQKQLSNVWPNWRISRKLGKGSYGNVYEIERDDLGARYTCALKVLHMETDTASAYEDADYTVSIQNAPSQRELYGTPPLVLPPCRHLPHPF